MNLEASPTDDADPEGDGVAVVQGTPLVVVEPAAGGLEVIVSDGVTASTVARLRVPGISTRLWTGYGCVTGSGRFVAAVFAPVEIVNHPERVDGTAFLAVVDLVEHSVVLVEELVALKYHSPGCGPSDEIAAVRYPGDGTTEVLGVDARTGGVASRLLVSDHATFPAPSGDAVVVSVGHSLLRVTADRSDVLEVEGLGGELVDLHANGDGGIDLLAVSGDGVVSAQRIDGAGEVSTAAEGPIGGVRWEQGRAGDNVLVVVDADLITDAEVAAVVVDELPDAVSLDGLLTADVVEEAAPPVRAPGGPAVDRSTEEFRNDSIAVSRDGGAERDLPIEGPATAKRPVLSLASAAAALVADPNQQVCAVPINDPEVQVRQPSAAQIEWAVHRVVRSELDVVRPADWQNNNLSYSYSPKEAIDAAFVTTALRGGGRIPAQVLMGVLAQESNFWQASRGALPGVAGNPLVGNYHGVRFSGGRIISVDPSKADCGYGVGQITDGMRLSDAGGKFTADQQKMIATDYAANIVAAHNILVEKWNQLWDEGLLTPGMNPADVENWYFPVWAYNTGYNKGAMGEGLGWTNNPANSDYRFDRLYFQRASLDDAKRPGEWPYQERVFGFVERGLWVFGKRSFTPIPGWLNLPVLPPDPANPTAPTGTRPVDRFVLCTAHNQCRSDHFEGGTGPIQGDRSFCTRPDRRCWWSQPAPFLPPGWATREDTSSYRPGTSEPSVANPYPAACTAAQAELPPFGVVPRFPANTIIIDDVPSGTGNVAGCSAVKTQGSFDISFAAPVAAADFGQLGTGYGGHFWFTHTNWATRPSHTITGTWRPPPRTRGWHRVLVHIPTVGADTYQADYRIYDGTERPGVASNFHRVVNQRWNRNQWVDLGIFQLSPGARIELSNVTYSDHGQFPELDGGDLSPGDAFYADGKVINIAWDAVALIPTSRPLMSYVALGDSFSSGEGELGSLPGRPPHYLPNSDIPETSSNETNACHRSTRAYGPVAFAQRLRTPSRGTFALIACSGAVIDNLVGPQTHWGEVPQLRQGWIDRNTTHVTIGIGGNDVRFATILQKCLTPSLSDCQDLPLDGGNVPLSEAIKTDIADLRERYGRLIDEIRDLAPNSRIHFVGYPEVIKRGWEDDFRLSGAPANPECSFLTDGEIAWFDSQVAALNGEMRRAALANGSSFVDLVPTYQGREACGRTEWINSVPIIGNNCRACNILKVRLAGSFHPNAQGHAAAGRAVAARLQ